jgi:DDE superfamily endonuclease
VKKYLTEEYGVEISLSVVCRILKSHNIRTYSQRIKPALTPAQKLARLVKCREWDRSMTDRSWRRVLFTDETTITRVGVTRPHRRLLRKGTPLAARRMHAFPKYGGGSITLWAAMSPQGIIASQFCSSHISAKEYKELLQAQMPRILSHPFARRHFTFQQDNAPGHTAKKVMRLLNKLSQKNGFDLLEWPPISPDLSPIENLWHILKDRLDVIAGERGDPKDLAELKARVVEVIAFLNAPAQRHYFTALYKSMTKRVRRVVAFHGAAIDD